MSEPLRPPPRTDNTEMEPQGPLDPTLMRPEGAPAPRLGADVSIFAPPQVPGDLGAFGRYRVLKKLGQGGMGAVYLGHDTSLARRVALKVMLPEYAADPEAHERFLREARAAAVVRSDHVVTIFDVGVERGVPFIAMEYLLGYPLDQFLHSQGNPSLAHVIRIGRETALGLSVAHKLGLIHRDVKPGNIWLEAPRGRVKLLDFGLARGQNDDTHLTDSGLVVGTPAFMSPEQARGLKLDPRSDLFSLGVMLYRLATGKMPFSGETTMAVLTSLAVDTPVPARQVKPTVPEALETIIAKLLAKNPADRFQSAREVVDALSDVETERQKPVAGQGPVEAVPMAISAQTEFIQAELVPGGEASGSSPQVLATGIEPEPIVRKKPGRKKPVRKKSGPGLLRWPVVVVGVGVLAVAVLAVFLLWPRKGTLTIQSDDPDTEVVLKKDGVVVRERTKDREFRLKTGSYTIELAGRTDGLKLSADKVEVVKNGRATVSVTVNRPKPIPPPLSPPGTAADPADSERVAADWVLSLGGTAYLQINGAQLRVTPQDELPKSPFQLVGANVSRRKATDAGLANLRDCKNLGGVDLSECPDVTDVGLAHLRGQQNLVSVNIGNCPKVTDAGLAAFKDRKKITHLIMPGCSKVTDAGLANFRGCTDLILLNLAQLPEVGETGLASFSLCTNLTYLNLDGGAKVTDAALAHFRGCRSLVNLRLNGCVQVGIDGLTHFRGCKMLAELDVQKTRAKRDQLDSLRDALPQCRILYDGGTIEPKKK